MIRLCIMDVEGVITLPGGSQCPWPLVDLLALREFFAAAGTPGVLCTGRQEPYGEAVIQALGLFHPLPAGVRERIRSASGLDLLAWPSILENGGYFYDPVAKQPFPHPALSGERLGQLRQLRHGVLERVVLSTGAQFEPSKDTCISLNPPLVDAATGARASTADLRARVEEALAGHLDSFEVRHSASAVDVTVRGVSKASAVGLLLTWTGLDPGEVLGVGDSEADRDWLARVGVRAAPANGREALPDVDYCSPLPAASGLLDILQRLAVPSGAAPVPPPR